MKNALAMSAFKLLAGPVLPAVGCIPASPHLSTCDMESVTIVGLLCS
jgi:hypothetical protein